MSYSIERLNNPDVYLVTLNEDFEIQTELPQYFKELSIAINNEPEPLNLIVDVSNLGLSFDDLLGGTKGMMNADRNPYLHPNSKTAILVTKNRMIKMSLDGFAKLGIAKTTKVVESVEEALQLASAL